MLSSYNHNVSFFWFWFQCRTVQSPQFLETRIFQIQVKSTHLDTKSHLNVIKNTTRKAWLPKCAFLGGGLCCLLNVQVSNLCPVWDNFWVLALFFLLDSAEKFFATVHAFRLSLFENEQFHSHEVRQIEKNTEFYEVIPYAFANVRCELMTFATGCTHE